MKVFDMMLKLSVVSKWMSRRKTNNFRTPLKVFVPFLALWACFSKDPENFAGIKPHFKL